MAHSIPSREGAELVEHNYYFKLGEQQQWLIDQSRRTPTCSAGDTTK
ncbi:MAG: hypothetical protein Ct9H300mP7_3080 [Verrucomicrobiota bacterium]|nr:MAG: hypothetical protein Ct9H300mP7_3080 [Verrucomicrobiota bacterium]